MPHVKAGFWKCTELAAIATGIGFSPAACMSYCNWNWKQENVELMMLTTAPYLLFAFCGCTARKLMHSHVLDVFTALLAILLTSVLLLPYMMAAEMTHSGHSHSGGMFFFILPIWLLWSLPVIFTVGIIVSFALETHRKNSKQI